MWTIAVILAILYGISKIIKVVYNVGFEVGRATQPPAPPVNTAPSLSEFQQAYEAWTDREAALCEHYTEMKRQRDDAIECRDRAIRELDEALEKMAGIIPKSQENVAPVADIIEAIEMSFHRK